MKKLTTAEEEVMQILWKIGKGFVKDLIEHMPEPKPAYNTVSTIVRILETKGFIGHTAYGKTHEYFPLVSQEEYSNSYLHNIISGYFSGSFTKMVSFFVKQNDLDIKEVEALMQHLKTKQDDDPSTSNS